MKEIKILPKTGKFAEDKDAARNIRLSEIIPALEKEDIVILDFQGVDSATQSFIHALISDIIRKNGTDILERLIFKNCNSTVKKIISIVVDYMQDINENNQNK
ncbi:MAG TPA: STAS-like domain-containing protein [archaeon]|nr:STAS-like domain-containing protein [archaeon]